MTGRWDALPATKYICVDAHVDSYGSAGYYIDRLFYFTIVRCGALPCGLYKQIKVINCVVCSKWESVSDTHTEAVLLSAYWFA